MASSARVSRKRPHTSLTDNADLPVNNETVDTAPPPPKRAALMSPAEVQANLDSSDDEEFEEQNDQSENDSSHDMDEDEDSEDDDMDEDEDSEDDFEEDFFEDFEEEDEDADSEEEDVHWENGSSHNTDEDGNDDLPTAGFGREQHPFTIDQTNVVRFWFRVRYMIETLLRLVKGLNAIIPGGKERPICRDFFGFLNRADVEHLIELFRSAVPVEVQSVLGQTSFEVNDLLALTGDWREMSPGVYLDILTRSDRSPEDWHRRYVGSATSKSDKKCTGLWNRIRTYFGWIKDRNVSAKRDKIIETGGAHGRCCMEDNVEIQFVILAKFSDDTNSMYVILGNR